MLQNISENVNSKELDNEILSPKEIDKTISVAAPIIETKQIAGTKNCPYKLAIIGSGPAGMKVDLQESLPTKDLHVYIFA